MNRLLLPRLASLIAIALAVVCGSQSVYAGVMKQSSWDRAAQEASADRPVDMPQRETLERAEQGAMQNVSVSGSGGSQTVALPTSLIRLADSSVTGRLIVVDSLLPDDPYLDALPKPA